MSAIWLETGYLAYNSTGFMYEKYNAFEMGVGGGGGEYTPQVGFGWTNGVALVMLNWTYPDIQPVTADDDEEDNGGLSAGMAALVAVLCIGFVVGIAAVGYRRAAGTAKWGRGRGRGGREPTAASAEIVEPIAVNAMYESRLSAGGVALSAGAATEHSTSLPTAKAVPVDVYSKGNAF